jgi:hypothetical protein
MIVGSNRWVAAVTIWLARDGHGPAAFAGEGIWAISF